MEFRKVKVSKLGIDIVTHDPVIIMTDEAHEVTIPLVVGIFEATSIAFALEHNNLPRPLAHDLIKTITENLGAQLQRVEIYDIKQDTYYCNLVFADKEGKIIEIDARPSDAIAIALRTHSDIFIAEHLIARTLRPHLGDAMYADERNGIENSVDADKENEVEDFLNNLDSLDFDDNSNVDDDIEVNADDDINVNEDDNIDDSDATNTDSSDEL